MYYKLLSFFIVAFIIFVSCSINNTNGEFPKVEYVTNLNDELVNIGDKIEFDISLNSNDTFPYKLTYIFNDSSSVIEESEIHKEKSLEWRIPWNFCRSNCGIKFEVFQDQEVIYDSTISIKLELPSREEVEKAKNFFPISEDNRWFYKQLSDGGQYGLDTSVVEFSLNFTDTKPTLVEFTTPQGDYSRFFFNKLYYDSSNATFFRVDSVGNSGNLDLHNYYKIYLSLAFTGYEISIDVENLFRPYGWFLKAESQVVSFDGKEYEAKKFEIEDAFTVKTIIFIEGIGIYESNNGDSYLHGQKNYFLCGAIIDGETIGDPTCTD